MRHEERAVILVLMASLCPGTLSSELVCAPADLQTRVSKSKFILFGKLGNCQWKPNDVTCVLEVLRSSKGKVTTIRLHQDLCEDCGSMGIDYVLVYADKDPYDFDTCNAPLPIHLLDTQRQIAALDKRLHYMPLEVPPESLKPPPGYGRQRGAGQQRVEADKRTSPRVGG